MPQPKSKKQSYEIILTSTQVHRVTVKASSVKVACKILQRKIGGKPVRDTSVATHLIEHVWSHPSDEGQGWLAALIDKSCEIPGVLMTWNGERIHTHSADEIIGNAVQASVTRHLKP